MAAPKNDKPVSANDANEDRRKFLATCGKFAVITPPAITMLLSTSLTSSAIAHSSGQGNYPGGSKGEGRGRNRGGGSSEWHRNNGIRSNRSSFWDWDWDNDQRRKYVKRQDTGRM